MSYNDDDEELRRKQEFHDRSFWFGLIMMVCLVATCSGCAGTLTEDQKYERAEKEILRLEAFEMWSADCVGKGARVQITRRSFTPRHCRYIACPPARGDRVECVR